MKKDALGDRMKSYYESRTRYKLPRRTNTIIRLDGKSFGTFTKDMVKPFDPTLTNVMNETAKFLCENIQGAVMAYVQSDEISILLTDYNKLTTDAWFDGNIQKICSVSASMATAKFNELIKTAKDCDLAFFDSRVFTISQRTEVINYFYWRQQDAVRNSIQMLARSMYSDSECYKKNSSQLQEMCFQKGKNWNDINDGWKRGRIVTKEMIEIPIPDNIGVDLLKKGDERLVRCKLGKRDSFFIKTFVWTINPAIDFNKNKELFENFLILEKNLFNA